MYSISQATRKLNLKIPRINPKQPSYHVFLANLVSQSDNTKHLAKLRKENVDEHYAQAVIEALTKDPVALRFHMNEVSLARSQRVL